MTMENGEKATSTQFFPFFVISRWLGIEGGHVARRVRQFFFAALDVHVLLQRWCHQLVSS
jgi:hypothetical protein